MSDLQVSLIVLALIAIAGVWLFNRVVEMRRTRVFEQRLKPRPAARTSEPEAGPVEPVLRSEPTFVDPETGQATSLAAGDAETGAEDGRGPARRRRLR